ncbi:uncharacterized protein LOC112558831 isoform X2 [Pomacea canaliculata]|nr:uncharacterized protein LOC112558831 isoform X2 [Pomacea canaliculata]
MREEVFNTHQSVSELTLPHLDVPVKQEFSFPSQEMQPYYCEKPGDSIQINAKKEVFEEQVINSVAGCHDKSSICAAAGSSEKRLSSPVLNEGDGRFSPGFGGKLRNYSPGLIEVLFSQMVESENGNIEKAKEKLLKRLASTLRQDRNQLSSATSFPTVSSSTTLPESLHLRGRPTSDLEFACKLPHSNSTEAHMGGPSLSSISCSASYTTSHSGQRESLSVQHEDVSEHYDQPAAYPADADTKSFRISQPATNNFQEPNFSVNCSQFERSVDSSTTLVHTQKNYNCLFQETTSRSLDATNTQSKSWHGNEKLHNTFSQNSMHPAASHLESGSIGNHNSFPSDNLLIHDRNSLGQGSALSDQLTHCHRPQVSDCSDVLCPTRNFVSLQSHSRVFSEDCLNQCKDLLRDTDEVLSFDSNSSLSSGKQTPLPDENSWEETMQLLEKNIISKFELIKNRQEARDKYFKENLGRKNPSPLPQLKDMDALWMALMKSLESLNGSIIGFCKEVPGFGELDHFDQEILLKHAYYDIWILTQSEFFVGGESYLLLSDGTFYTRVLMEQVVGKEITDTMHRFAQQFNALGLSHREKALLCSIQLTTIPQNHHDLQKPEDVQKLNSFYLDLLVHAVNRNHGASSSRVLVDIFRMVPLLAEVNRMQREIIGSLKIDNPFFKK